MKPKMTPRAMVALGTAGFSLFLLLCFAGYGRHEALAALPQMGFSDRIASWCVGPLGVGAHLIATLGVAWGVIVYFQERTPDLVLRMAGTATLAASAAMLSGLWRGGEWSLWAGTLGTSGARALMGFGTFGIVLGWLGLLTLFSVSAVFATDWLFHTLRRGRRPAFDPRTLPTEPSRGDLLVGPAESEPREFVREESRAAVAASEIEASEPPLPEVRTEALPKGCSSVLNGPRALVRGPTGYAGVEFLSTSDELAIPEPPVEMRTDVSVIREEEVFASFLDDEFHVAEEPAAEAAAPPPAPVMPVAPAAPAPPAPVAAAAPVAPVAPVEPVEEPSSGIGFADESFYLDDEILSVGGLTLDGVTDLPHDGASTAAEIASSLAAPVTEEFSSAAEPVQPASRLPYETAPTGAAFGAAEAEANDASADDELVAPRFFDDVVVGGSFEDDFLVVADAQPEFTPPAPFAPTASALSTSAPAAAVLEAPAARETSVETYAESFDEAAEAPEIQSVEIEDAAVLGLEIFEQAEVAVANVALVEASPVEEPEALAPAVAEAVPAVAEDTPAVADEIASVVEEIPVLVADSEEAPVEAVSEPEPAPAEAAEAAVPAVAERFVRPAVDWSAPSIPAAPVASETPAEPMAAEASAPAEIVAAPVAAAATSQLKLFEPPSCDLSKLRGMELDPLLVDAAEAILNRGRASAVVLQRTLGIGYARGLRILDQMTEAGMLGPDSAGGAREICFTRTAWDAFSRGA